MSYYSRQWHIALSALGFVGATIMVVTPTFVEKNSWADWDLWLVIGLFLFYGILHMAFASRKKK